jgi:GrpB-like predicted nucleotidyltransferase (UPF0157 family)
LTRQGNDQADQPAIFIADYDPEWPLRFAALGSQLRHSLGPVALRIDHIGSTSVSGLAAKPVIDIQVSVERLETAVPFRDPLQELGFVYRAANTDRTKRYFREPPGQPRTHIHVRKAGSFSPQVPLLFRDFLRARREAAAGYEAVKRRLAARYPNNRRAYTDAKTQVVWGILQRADEWAQQLGWDPGPSDA